MPGTERGAPSCPEPSVGTHSPPERKGPCAPRLPLVCSWVTSLLPPEKGWESPSVLSRHCAAAVPVTELTRRPRSPSPAARLFPRSCREPGWKLPSALLQLRARKGHLAGGRPASHRGSPSLASLGPECFSGRLQKGILSRSARQGALPGTLQATQGTRDAHGASGHGRVGS